MTFVLDGRDQLSRVFNRVGDNANQLHRRISASMTNSSSAVNRFTRDTANGMAGMRRDTGAGAKAIEGLKSSVISLAPAAIPAVSAMAPLAAGTGAVAVAALAFTAALVPQIGALSEAAEAEKAYDDAVKKSGRTSEAAITAQVEYQRTMAELPPETRRAAASLGILKDEYKDWSNSLAADTMAPVTKGISLFNGLLPKTSGLVKGTSQELDRMVTIAGGAMSTPGFDRVNSKFTAFATGTLRKVTDGLVHLMRTGDGGKVGGGASEFMDFAREQGPVVADTLRNVASAVLNILQAGADTGVGMLQLVNALSSIVAAVPPAALSALLQLAIAIKLVKVAALGLAAGRAAMAAFGVSLVAMQVAAAGAPGRLAAVTAAIGTLSRGAKIALAGTAIGLVVMAIAQLSSMGDTAPPDVDKLTTALGKLGQSGQVTGEAATQFGSKFEKLKDQINEMTSPSVAESINNWGADISGGMLDAGDATEKATASINSVDESLANLVRGGKADLAKAALQNMLSHMDPTQVQKMKEGLDGYDSALADAKFEADHAAQSMGLFGAQAQAVQAKLDGQKASTDGLRQSIMALNEVNRAALDGRAGMEASIDAAAKATKGHGDALRMSNGELNLNTEKARTAQAALTDLARKTEENVSSARNSGKSWDYAKGQYDRGRAAIIRSADAMGLSRNQAVRLADQIMRTPNKTAYLKGNLSDLQAKLAAAKDRLGKVPDSRKAQVRAEIRQLNAAVAQAKARLAEMDGRTATATVRTNYVQTYQAQKKPFWMLASGGPVRFASGGPVGYPGGGSVRGEGTGTSDSILARLSNNEYVIKARSVAKYGVSFLNALNEGRLSMASALGSGGGGAMGGAGREVGRGLSSGMAASTAGVEGAARQMAGAVLTGIRAELQIASPSKKTRALAADAGKGMLIGLTGSKAKISAVAKDLVKDIWAAWKGTRSTKDSSLVRMVNRDTKKLQTLASKRDAIESKVAAGKKFAADVTSSAREGASLGNLGLDAEEVTAGSIKGGLAAKLQKMKTFTSYINTLGKRGLSKTLLRQILNMGPEAGYAYASALAGASNDVIKSVNSTQAGIDKASTTLGRDGADRLYDSGKNAGKGFLKGLISQEKAIEAQMLKIAKGMQRAIKKALGIKSPSTVMAKLGRYTTEGLAAGLTQPMPAIDQALAAVTSRVASARPVMGAAVAADGRGGRGGQPVNVQIDIHSALDPVAVGREVQRVLLSLKRTHGLNINLGVG
ncbi:hypothetical protein [Streptomyces sp. H27-C3]|uniref:hypothetical protein n=1 Tax=Streptomyces sp. H27-C3 TaxID=3046305 RepID=UPI0024B9E659|nr:hypothetical protein [Streptomyces sp. H27-C3]MDJ0461551.1 hypothetical protein [Streptomyces sp. H27-C3]